MPQPIKKNVVLGAVRLDAIRRPLETLAAAVEEQPTSDPLKGPARAALTTIGLAVRLLESVSTNHAATVRRQALSIGQLAEQAARDRTLQQQFGTAQDRRSSEREYQRQLESDASRRALERVGSAFAEQAKTLASDLVQRVTAYERALKRAKVEAQAPTAGLSADEVTKLDFEARQFRLWSPQRFLAWVNDATELFDEKQLQRLRLQVVGYVQGFREKPLTTHAREKLRPSAVRTDQAAIRALERISEGLQVSTYPDWLTIHDEQLFPQVLKLFRVTCGIDARQLGRSEFTRLYLTAGDTPTPLAIAANWPARYCDTENIEAAAKMFEIDYQPATPSVAKRRPLDTRAASEKGQTTRQERIAARAKRIEEHKAARAAAEQRRSGDTQSSAPTANRRSVRGANGQV